LRANPGDLERVALEEGFMKIVECIGLLIGVVAAILMACYPPRIRQYTEKGEGAVSFVANATEEGKRWGKRQQWLSAVAPRLLGLAFLIQFVVVLSR
jgi:hypothetical protein